MISNFLNFVANLPRSVKGILLLGIDVVILGFSLLLAIAVRFDIVTIESQYRTFSNGAWILIGMQLLALLLSGLYRSVLRHAGSELLVLLLRSVLLGAGIFALMNLMLVEFHFPRSIIVISAAFAFLGLLSVRLMIRWVVRIHVVEPQQREKLKRVAIYGAGSAGLQLYESLRLEGTYQLAAFVDDNPKLQGGLLRGKSILSFAGLQTLHANNPLDSVLLALPGIKHEQRKKNLGKLLEQPLIRLAKPFGLLDYIKLQMAAFCVVSDSGSITEEASLLNLPAITIRNVHERPEGMDEGTLVMSGLKKERVLDAVRMVTTHHVRDKRVIPVIQDYQPGPVSKQIVRVVLSYMDYINRTVWSKP